MRVVVTGANGLVGSRLSALLAQRGHHVTGCSRGPWRGPLEAIQRFEYRSCQLSNEREVRELFAVAQPEVVIHCASMTDVDACERDPLAAYASNVESAAQISSNARLLRAHVICVSTDYVFDGAAGPYSEDAVPTPHGVYSTTKHIAEQIVQTLASSWAIARTAVVYGWPPSGRSNFGSWLVTALGQKQQVRLFEDQFVSPSWAVNVAEMLVELAERKLTGIWNTCGATVVNRVEFGALVCEIFGFDKGLLIPSRLRDAKLIAPRPPHSGLKTNKAQQELAHQPLELPAALQKFHAEWRHA
jgi:dTDP-4-dehydrorhamnose reductase